MVVPDPSLDISTDMCQSTAEFIKKPNSEGDDEFKWEEFFGTSVDISSSLLDMFDTMVAKNSANSPLPSPTIRESSNQCQKNKSEHPCDPGGLNTNPIKQAQIPSSDTRMSCGKSSYSESAFEEKKRPLSTSSVSSSSSSSSSSLPRNGLDVKKSYLASIESLDDDDDVEDVSSTVSSTIQQEYRGPMSQICPGTTNAKPRWCDPNLSLTDRVLLEIVDTEKTYVRDLHEIIEGYLKYINRMNHPKVSPQYLEELFSNIEDIFLFNRSFVAELELCEMDSVAMAKCFVNNNTGFEVYTQYCTNYPRTVSVLTELMGNSETAEIFKERQVALQHNLPLGSYLLKPVQRILKYHLLLQNLVKHADKENSACTDIRNALCVMTGIAYHINDMKRKHEHAVRVQEIQSLLYGWEGQDLTTYGELVAEGAFRMYRAKALRHLFLFDKMILIAKKKEEGILSYKTHIMCSNLMLIESIQGEPLCFHVIPFDNPRFQYTFQARNMEQKREWCLQLKRVIIENYNAVIPFHARQLVMELGQSKTDDSAVEKTTSKRQLSAPEYLERRKQERRKSEINLKRGFRLKNSSKKGESPDIKKVPSSRRKHSFNIIKRETPHDNWSNQLDRNSWTKSQDDVNQSANRNRSYSNSSNGNSNTPLFSRDTRFRHSLPEPSLSQRTAKKEKSFRQSWRAWNSVPEETTDTENEELNESISPQRGYRPVTQSFENESFEEPYDSSGEYVTFFYAHSYLTRNRPDSMHLRPNSNYGDVNTTSGVNNETGVSSPSHVNNCLRENGLFSSSEHSNVSSLRKPTAPKDPDSESNSSGHSWRHSAAIRRVQSFTGMAKAKMSSLHHNISFKHHSSRFSRDKKGNRNHPSPSASEIISSASQDFCQTELHIDGTKKSDSLPRSFQVAADLVSSLSDTNLASHTDSSCHQQLRPKNDVDKSSYIEHRPFTIAADNPLTVDFSNGAGNYVLQFSPDPDDDYCLLIRRDYQEPDTTGCTNTPAISMENVNSIHPELKIYHQAASKYSTLKQVFANMTSKIANLRSAFSHSPAHDPGEKDVGDFTREGVGRSSSRSSVRSEGDLGSKILSARLAHSVARAYSSILKQKTKKTGKGSPDLKTSEDVRDYKSKISLIGARMAHPESEYTVPKNVISPEQFQRWKEDLRPDSMFSEYSNATSSDGDKTSSENPLDEPEKFQNDEAEDSTSEASESSADSYYERTFDAIESALAEDMFRDSAIYSDPEDADFGTVEAIVDNHQLHNRKQELAKNVQNGLIPTKLDFICKHPVNQSILERLKILEENAKCHKEETPIAKKRITPTRGDAVSLSSKSHEPEESETSSEHSVSTVMESGAYDSVNAIEMFHIQPRVKGWVKHVVEKLQGESKD